MIIKDAEYLFEPYELQMVLRNKMEHLLSMQIMISDGKTEYWYDVTGMQSLAAKTDHADCRRDTCSKSGGRNLWSENGAGRISAAGHGYCV